MTTGATYDKNTGAKLKYLPEHVLSFEKVYDEYEDHYIQIAEVFGDHPQVYVYTGYTGRYLNDLHQTNAEMLLLLL